MTNDELINAVCNELRSVYGCHTAILYGSRARDDWDEASDVDVIAFRNSGEQERVASRWNGVFLDLFIYPDMEQPDPSWIRITGGQILFQTDGYGDRVLDEVKRLFDEGPERVPVAELRVRKAWAQKMLERAAKQDIEGNYRMHWLLFVLLEDYFAVRDRWYLGPKKSLRLINDESEAEFRTFETAFAPGASIAEVQCAIDLVFEGI